MVPTLSLKCVGESFLLLLLLSHFSRVRLYETPWTAAYQAPLSMGFSRQEYWSGVPLPTRCTTNKLQGCNKDVIFNTGNIVNILALYVEYHL